MVSLTCAEQMQLKAKRKKTKRGFTLGNKEGLRIIISYDVRQSLIYVIQNINIIKITD
jgi:hypothetical protein